MSHSARSDPLVVTWPLDESILSRVLAQKSESPRLDHKLTIDLSKTATKDRVELIKDVAAFANSEGGYIVFGIRNGGSVEGLDEHVYAGFDEAIIRQKIESCLKPPPDLFVHRIEDFNGKRLIVLVILPSKDSPLVFLNQGSYKDKSGEVVQVFQPGDVFVRRGSKSERWQQEDVAAVIDRIYERGKEKWLHEITPFLKISAGQSSSTPTLHDAPSPYEDAVSYGKSIRVLLRSSDERALRETVLTCLDVAREQWRNTKEKSEAEILAIRDDHLRLALDRLALVGLLAISYKTEATFAAVVDALVKVWELGDDRSLGFRGKSSEHLSASVVWRQVLLRVYALGTALVQANLVSWARPLVLQKSTADAWLPWLRRTQVTMFREERWDDNALINEVLAYVRDHPEFRPELDLDKDLLTAAVCQFDFLQVAIACLQYDRTDVGFPSFAKFHTFRTLPMIERAIEDSAVREVLGQPPDQKLADFLRELDRTCIQLSFTSGEWDSNFDQNPIVMDFLRRNPPSAHQY